MICSLLLVVVGGCFDRWLLTLPRAFLGFAKLATGLVKGHGNVSWRVIATLQQHLQNVDGTGTLKLYAVTDRQSRVGKHCMSASCFALDSHIAAT